MYSRGSTVYEKNRNNFDLGYEMGRKSQKCRKFLLLDRLLKVHESILQYLLHVKGSPPSGPLFLKNGQINRVTKVSSTFGPTESDSEKKIGWLP